MLKSGVTTICSGILAIYCPDAYKRTLFSGMETMILLTINKSVSDDDLFR